VVEIVCRDGEKWNEIQIDGNVYMLAGVVWGVAMGLGECDGSCGAVL